MKKGKVYIAGAGAGDVGCLTLKVKDIIEKADIILYDNLVSDEILSLSSPKAVLVDVGKIASFHKLKQEDINNLLIEFSKKYDIVLRLKGGTPFVFGRGAEEAEVLLKNDVDFEIMQGVSSVTSVPESMGIPLTHREFASSFYVVTGRKKRDFDLNEDDYKKIASLKDTTLVFMMSVAKANIIAQNLISAGKNKNTKAAIISNGTLANAKKYEYTLEELSQVKDTGIFDTPGMLIVGEVVKLSDKLNSLSKKLLNGKRIIINVPKEKGDKLQKKLYNLGAQVLNVSTNCLEKKYDRKEILNFFDNNNERQLKILQEEIIKEVNEKNSNKLLKKLENINNGYICFTSAYAVDIFFEILKENSIDIRQLFGYKICVVGSATSDKLKSYGIISDIMPNIYDAKSLAEELINQRARKVICILPHNIQSDLYTKLLENNIDCVRINIYEKKSKKVKIYREKTDDIYVFTSSSSVTGLVNSYEKEHFRGSLAFCIGKQTQKSAEQYGFNTVMSDNATIDELIRCIEKYYA